MLPFSWKQSSCQSSWFHFQLLVEYHSDSAQHIICVFHCLAHSCIVVCEPLRITRQTLLGHAELWSEQNAPYPGRYLQFVSFLCAVGGHRLFATPYFWLVLPALCCLSAIGSFMGSARNSQPPRPSLPHQQQKTTYRTQDESTLSAKPGFVIHTRAHARTHKNMHM